MASVADQYVPLHSARMQLSDRVLRDARLGPAVKSMVRNLASQMGCPAGRLVRVLLDRNYDAQAPGVAASADRFIGRSAHISYLEHVPTCVFLTFLLAPYLLE